MTSRATYKSSWYQKNRERILAKRRLYVVQNREAVSDYNKTYYEEVVKQDLPKLHAQASSSRAKLKKTVFGKLGGSCPCGEQEHDFLVVDHVNDDGAEHRRLLRASGLSSASIYREIRDGKETRKYQLLCWNCNFKKIPARIKDSLRPAVIWERRYREKLRLAALAKTGMACACCGENDVQVLTIDHVHGGGNIHRKLVGGVFGVFRLIRDTDDMSAFQTLCWNCNLSKGFHGACAHKRKCG